MATPPVGRQSRYVSQRRVTCLSTGFSCVGLDLEYVNLSFTAARWLKIAVVKPVFTATAYSSYYQFYAKYANIQPNTTVTTDLNLLNASLVDDWGISTFLINFLNSTAARDYGLNFGKNLQALSDVDVHQGALFYPNGARRYDAAILGFTEYVTAEEYQAYKRFVGTGGTLIIMDASNFVAEVRYYPGSLHASLYRGHNWFFNGTTAVKDVFERWKTDLADWVASNTWQQIGQNYNGSQPSAANPIGRALWERFGGRVFTYYHGSEENYVSNFTLTSIIATWLKTTVETQHFVASYLHRHHLGHVIHFGAFGSEVIAHDPTVPYFLARSVLYAAQASLSLPRLTFLTNFPRASITMNGTQYNNTQTDYFAPGNQTLTTTAPQGYGFSRWNPAGGLSVTSETSKATTLTITSSGILNVYFYRASTPLSPLVTVMSAVILSSMLRLVRHGGLRGPTSKSES